MIITKIKISNFGKFKDLELNFGEKLNLIYGANEAGKTTLLAFIKAMLYGMDSRKRGIRENDRRRFLPWSGEDGAGELYYRDQKEREYQISRRFKESRREPAAIIDTVTGSPMAGFTGENPGELILNLGEGAFTRTIYIPQLGSTVTADKEDEIMARLTNLQQTGDEQVSFQKGEKALEDAKKQITLRSGNGKLDRLLFRLEELREEKEQVQVLYEENIEDQWELNRLRDVLSSLQENIAREERKQQELKKHQQYLELKDLNDRAAEISALEREEKEIIKELFCGENQVDQDFLDQVKKLLADRQQLEKIIVDQEDQIEIISRYLAGLEASLKNFSGFSGLESEIEQEVLVKESKKSILANKLQELALLRQEKRDLEQELAKKKQELGHLAVFDDLSGELEEEILKKEARKNELEKLLKNQGDVDLLRRDLIVDKMKNARIMKNTGLVAAIGGFLGGLIYPPALFILALVGMILGLVGWFQKKKLQKDLEEIEARLGQVGNYVDLKQEMETLTKELNNIYHKFKVVDIQEFTGAKIKYTSKKNQLFIIETKINEREEQLNRADEKKLAQEHQEYADFIQSIYSKCGAASLEDFRGKFQEYRRIIDQKDKRLRDLENLKNQQENFDKQMEEKEKNTCYLLGLNGEAPEIIQRAEVILADLAAKLERKNQLVTKIETLRKNYQDLLKDRDLEKLEAGLEGYAGKDFITEEMEHEGTLERRLKAMRDKRVELEKQIVAITGTIENRFKDCREISRIEEDLASTAQEIKGYRQLLEVIDLTKNMLAESFQELQGSFGPLLNEKVGRILSGITGGRYDHVKVDENYQVTIRDQHSGDKVVDYFSNGTLDQVYFALRLGIVELVFGNEIKFPLILDDSFVQYDDRRLAAVLEFLVDYAQNHQVLLFTCHKREAQLLQGKDFTYLKLANGEPVI